MTLLICVFAAIIATVKWYQRKDDSLMLGVPCVLFWGASLMWLVDSVVDYIELGADFFRPSTADMVNDAFLGVCVVALGLIIWLVILVVKDPSGKIKASLSSK